MDTDPALSGVEIRIRLCREHRSGSKFLCSNFRIYPDISLQVKNLDLSSYSRFADVSGYVGSRDLDPALSVVDPDLSRYFSPR